MKIRPLLATSVATALVAAGAVVMACLAGDEPPARATTPQSARPVDPWTPPAQVKRSALLYDRFETIAKKDGLPSDRTTCVLCDGDFLAVGTDSGLAVRRAGKWTTYAEKDGLAHRYVTSLARDAAGDELWIGTLRGLSRLAGGALRTYRQTDSGLMNDVVYQVAVNGGLVWAATAAGTSVLDVKSGAWSLYDVKNTIMHEPWCYSVALGPERAWIGVWGGGICELNRKTGLWKEYRDPDGQMEIQLLRDAGPIHDVSSAVAYDDGVLWQGTYFGISRFDGRRWKTYDAADTGLPGDFVSQVASRGATVWLSTDQGLGVFDGTTCVSYKRRADGTCDVRVCRDGREVERRSLATAPADNYVLWTQGGESDAWIATGRGVCHAVADGGARKDK